MNLIDKNYKKLISTLETLTEDQIFEITKQKFLKIHPQTQASIQDFFQKFPYWGKLNIQNEEYEHFRLKAKTLSQHLEDFNWLYQNLGDYRSKKLLYAILNNWYQYDFTTLDSSHEKNYSHYFDLDLISCDKEVFVDLGAYIGDTILDFIHTYGETSYTKIYAYEISEGTIPLLEKNIEPFSNIIIKNKAVLDQEGYIYIQENAVDSSANTVSEHGTTKIETTSLDIDIKDAITIIKMDIEGSEQKALLGAKNQIQKNHPKLLLSVYHNLEDLWKIPKMIDKMCPDTYNYYLRSHGGSIFPTEITLIAILKK